MTKLEEIARAIANSLANAIAGGRGLDNETFDSVARAAVEAMMEPSVEMLQDGHRAAMKARSVGVCGMTIEAHTRAECAREGAAYRAMLRAILTEAEAQPPAPPADDVE